MIKINRQMTAQRVAQLMPNIIQGAHLGFMAKRAITQTQFFVLISVHAKGTCPMSVIAQKMNVRLPTMTGMVARLVAGGYLKRIVNPDDRRQVVVALASKGEEFLKQFKMVIGKRWESVLHILSQKELEDFYHIVTKLNQQLQEKES